MRWAGSEPSTENERGSAAFELPLIVGLVLIPFGLLVLLLPDWVERQTAARDGAAEVARAIVVGGAGIDTDQLLHRIEVGHGLAPGSLRLVEVSGRVPGELVTVRVSVVLPGRGLPVFGVVMPRTWTAVHTERRPDYGVVDE